MKQLYDEGARSSDFSFKYYFKKGGGLPKGIDLSDGFLDIPNTFQSFREHD